MSEHWYGERAEAEVMIPAGPGQSFTADMAAEIFRVWFEEDPKRFMAMVAKAMARRAAKKEPADGQGPF